MTASKGARVWFPRAQLWMDTSGAAITPDPMLTIFVDPIVAKSRQATRVGCTKLIAAPVSTRARIMVRETRLETTGRDPGRNEAQLRDTDDHPGLGLRRNSVREHRQYPFFFIRTPDSKKVFVLRGDGNQLCPYRLSFIILPSPRGGSNCLGKVLRILGLFSLAGWVVQEYQTCEIEETRYVNLL